MQIHAVILPTVTCRSPLWQAAWLDDRLWSLRERQHTSPPGFRFERCSRWRVWHWFCLL